MIGFAAALGLLIAGIVALFAILHLIAPTGLRARPSMKNDPQLLGGEFNSGRGGHATVWSVPRDSRDHAKIWSEDRK